MIDAEWLVRQVEEEFGDTLITERIKKIVDDYLFDQAIHEVLEEIRYE